MDYEQEDWTPEKKKARYLPAILVIVFLIPLLIGGFFAIKQAKKMDRSQQKSPQVTIKTIENNQPKDVVVNEISGSSQATNPTEVVRGFYEWYLAQPFAERKQYANHKSIESSLADNLKKQGPYAKDFDPILCNIEQPSRIEVSLGQIDDLSATTFVNAHYKSIVPIQVNLVKIKTQWQISNISCLEASSPLAVIENLKKDMGADYVETDEVNFVWNLPSDKSRKTKVVKGKGFTASNVNSNQSLSQLLLNNGFKKDEYNQNGYKKDNVVCLASQVENAQKKLNLELKCGLNQ